MTTSRKSGFTLIELSIVLVIIGLLVGGVLVGRDLIKSSEIRSQISQINEFTTAVNTFKVKYGYLPGDMPPNEAAALGFFEFQNANKGKYVPVVGFPPTGYAYGNNDGAINTYNEQYPFWSHLSDAKMLKGNYGGVKGSFIFSDNVTDWKIGGSNITLTTVTNVAKILPQAKIGGAATFVNIVGNHYLAASDPNVLYSNTQKANLFEINDYITGNPILSALEMYQIDSKIDDGLPTTGSVRDSWTQDGGSGTYLIDDISLIGYACTKLLPTDTGNNLAQEYDLSPATANDKNCTTVDFLF